MKNTNIKVKAQLIAAGIFSILVFLSPLAVAQDPNAVDQALNAIENLPAPQPAVAAPAPEADPDLTIGILDFKDQDILDVLRIIGEKSRLDIKADDHIRGRVSVYLDNVDVWDALRIILEMHQLAYAEEGSEVVIMTDEEYAAKYGHKFTDAVQTRLIPVMHVSADEMIAALASYKSPTGKIIFIDKTKTLVLIDEPQRLQVMADLAKAKDVVLENKIFILRNTTVANIKGKIEGFLSENGVVDYNQTLNQIAVTDILQNLQIITDKIAELDKEIEIAFVGKILKIQLNDEHQQGIDWEAIVSNYQPIGLRLPEENASAPPAGKLSVGTISEEDFKVLFEALETVGTLETVGNPSVTIKPHQEAGIPLGLAEPFEFLIPPKSSDLKASKPSPGNKPKHDFYLELSLIPTVEERLALKLNPRFHWLSIEHGEEPQKLSVTSSSVDIKVPGTDMVVIGGLFQTKEVSLETRVPVIGSLPILGFFLEGIKVI